MEAFCNLLAKRNQFKKPKTLQSKLVALIMSRSMIATSVSLCIAIGAAAYAWSMKKQMYSTNSAITPPTYAWDTSKLKEDKVKPAKIQLPPRKSLTSVTKNGNDVNLEFLGSMTFANNGGVLRPPSCYCCR
jgi:hypothetical protein